MIAAAGKSSLQGYILVPYPKEETSSCNAQDAFQDTGIEKQQHHWQQYKSLEPSALVCRHTHT
jgi:hypothetical protein